MKQFTALFPNGKGHFGGQQDGEDENSRRRWGEYFHAVVEAYRETGSSVYTKWLSWASALDAHICEQLDTKFAAAKVLTALKS